MDDAKDLLVTEAEAAERRRFVIWLTSNFVVKKGAEGTMAVFELYDLYKEIFPSTHWYEEDMDEILYGIGFLSARYPVLRIEPNISYLQVTQNSIMAEKLLRFEWEPAIIKNLRKVCILNNIEKPNDLRPMNGYMVNALEVFYKLWCIDCKSSPLAAQLEETYRKAIVGNVRRAYARFCLTYKIPEQPWAEVKEYLIAKGHSMSSGYANRKAGQSYFRYLYVPGVVKEELDAAELNEQLLINIEEKWYLSDGAEVNPEDIEGNKKRAAARIEEIARLIEYQVTGADPYSKVITDLETGTQLKCITLNE